MTKPIYESPCQSLYKQYRTALSKFERDMTSQERRIQDAKTSAGLGGHPGSTSINLDLCQQFHKLLMRDNDEISALANEFHKCLTSEIDKKK